MGVTLQKLEDFLSTGAYHDTSVTIRKSTTMPRNGTGVMKNVPTTHTTIRLVIEGY